MKDYKNFRSNYPEKDNEDHIGGTSFKETAFWVMLSMIILVLVGIFIQNFYIMKYEKKIAFSNTSSSAGIEYPEGWEESDKNALDSSGVESPKDWEKSDENALDSSGVESPKGWEKSDEDDALDDFDIEGMKNHATSSEIENSPERTFVTKEVTTTATAKSFGVSTNVAVSEGVIREAKTDKVEQLIENSYGERVAAYAREFCKEYQGKVNYGVDFKLRKKAYWLIPEDDGTFTIDCVGLVNLVVHNATGFSLQDEGEYTGFVIPEGPKGSGQIAQVFEPFKFQDVIYDFHPGDVLTVDGRGHEVIYIGNNEILDITDSLEIKSVHEYKYSKRAQIVIGG